MSFSFTPGSLLHLSRIIALLGVNMILKKKQIFRYVSAEQVNLPRGLNKAFIFKFTDG